jgi:tetratricopeptide (TPR) repeat protein
VSLAGGLNPTQLIEQGDALYRQRRDLSKAQQALELYETALKEKPNSVEILWKISMVCHYLGMKTQENDELKQKLFTKGIELGEKSTALDSGCAPCHFWTGINLALYGESVGVMKTLSSLSKVESHLKKTVELEPSYAEGGGFRILGVIQQKVPYLLGGSKDQAQSYFKKAIASAPKDPLNYLFLAKLMLEREESNETIKSIVEEGLKYPYPNWDHVESIEARNELEVLHQQVIENMSKEKFN